MSTTMTAAAREQFLAQPHVGVLSVAVADDPTGTLAVPIWYDYAPDVGVWVITARTSAKAAALDAAGRFGIVAQSDELPYRYVSVEGPITETRPCDVDGDLLPMAIRYFGEDVGRTYAKQFDGDTTQNVYVMRPEYWRTADLTALFEDLWQSQGAG